jgi:aspartyl-tRNA(Asn)/glutamyl-tRNA(Gln) amidotransferase subunit A
LTLPCGFSKEGMPIGLQIGAAPYREAMALQVAYAYQQATDWHKQVPTILRG